jgi:hypothetical protein
MVGRDRVVAAMAKHMFRWLWLESGIVPAKDCTVSAHCRFRLHQFQSNHWKPVPKIIKALKPWDRQDFPGMCRSCTEAAQKAYEQGQVDFWKEAPAYFDLPPWKELN